MALLVFAVLGFFALELKPSTSEVIKINVNRSILRAPDIGYVHFIFHPQSKLEVKNSVQLLAQYPKQCALGCALNITCRSFNFGTQPLLFYQGNVQYLCELLSTDKYNFSSAFESINPAFNHYSIRSKCTDSPCLHNFPCLSNYTDDTYKCVCPRPPFKGKNCNDINECTSGQHDCSPNATCTNVIGSYICTCKSGYLGNGKNCFLDINECTSGQHDCSPNATCTNVIGSYNCTCKSGYLGNGKNCSLATLMAKVSENITSVPWIRCWSGSSDGWDVTNVFHPQCDSKGPTITIARKNKYIWGGYTDVPWTTDGGFKKSTVSFLFSLYNIIEVEELNPQRFDLIQTDYAVSHYPQEGPSFGAGYDFKIGTFASTYSTSCQSKPRSYNVPPGCTEGKSCPFYANQSADYTLDDVEVFYKYTL